MRACRRSAPRSSPTRRPTRRIGLPLVCALLASCAQAARTSTQPDAQNPVGEIRRTWLRYLESVAGDRYLQACRPSPFWDPGEQRQWPCYSLANLYLPDSATAEVRSIQPAAATDAHEYRVVTLFHTDSASSPLQSSIATMTVFAVRSDTGWLFANALPRLTRAWRRETVGPVTYVLEPGYSFDRQRAERAVAFTDSLAATFGVPPLEPLTYYLTSSSDEVFRIMGLETPRKWGPVGGVAQPVNRQLFSGIPAVGEDYRHELAHIVLRPLVSRTLYFISEGVPTWLGGTTGMDFPTAARGLGTLLSQQPSVTLDSILTGRFPPAQFYPAGGVFTLMAHEEGGVDAVKALFNSGVTVAEFRTAMERLFGRPWASIAAEWRRRALSFAADTTGRP